MNIKISASVGKTYDNSGSSGKAVNYLEKENDKKPTKDKEFFFSADKDKVRPDEVVKELDNNKKKLSKTDAKFFHLSVSPSEKELKHIGGSAEKLKDYTRSVMDKYAENFGKGLKGDDIMYFAKVEQNRYFHGDDKEVKNGQARTGQKKPGENMHVHILVSRKSKNGKLKLSPLTNHRNTKKGAIKGGFNRDEFVQSSESEFDKTTGYKRDRDETYEHYKIMKNGSAIEKASEKINVENLQRLQVQKQVQQQQKQIQQIVQKPSKSKGFGI